MDEEHTNAEADGNAGVRNDDDDDDRAAATDALKDSNGANSGREDAEAYREAAGALGDAGGKAVDRAGDQGEEAKDSKDASNPFRSVESAAERWEKKHANVLDLAEDEVDGGEAGEAGDRSSDPLQRFVREGEEAMDGDDRVMADATEEQLREMGHGDDKDDKDDKDGEDEREDEREDRGVAVDEDAADEKAMDAKDGEDGENDHKTADGDGRGHGKAPLFSKREGANGEDASHEDEEKSFDEEDTEERATPGEDDASHPREDDASPSASLIAHVGEIRHLSPEDKVQMQAELEERLARKAETGGGGGGEISPSSQKIWETCCQLTSQLSAELAEQLRLVLEPTQVSKLGGEYRSGKRINMKRVVGYIARYVIWWCGI